MLRTRGRRWHPQPGSPEERNGQGSSLGNLTWPLSPKGLIGPFFWGGLGVAQEPPPNCLAAGNNGAIVGAVECGQTAGTGSAPGAGPHPEPACPPALSPRCCQRQRHPPSPHLAGQAQTPGTSSTWRALQLCPRCHPDCHDPTGSRGMWARTGWGWGLTRQDVCL